MHVYGMETIAVTREKTREIRPGGDEQTDAGDDSGSCILVFDGGDETGITRKRWATQNRDCKMLSGCVCVSRCVCVQVCEPVREPVYGGMSRIGVRQRQKLPLERAQFQHKQDWNALKMWVAVDSHCVLVLQREGKLDETIGSYCQITNINNFCIFLFCTQEINCYSLGSISARIHSPPRLHSDIMWPA